jgi:hypothetical protein
MDTCELDADNNSEWSSAPLSELSSALAELSSALSKLSSSLPSVLSFALSELSSARLYSARLSEMLLQDFVSITIMWFIIHSM